MAMRLVCFDMDGVLFEHANFWAQLSSEYGVREECDRLVRLYLKADYPRLIKEIVYGIFLGKDEAAYFDLVAKVAYNPGVTETLRSIRSGGYRTLILSSGPLHLALRAQKDLQIDDVMANRPLFKDGKWVGGDWMVHEDGKAALLMTYTKEHRISMKDVVMVGDEANDAGPAMISGTSIAFNSSSEHLKSVCKHVVDGNDLRKILRYIP
jgi:phosphoserine phosphatase